jgi:histidine ammonia-lyase
MSRYDHLELNRLFQAMLTHAHSAGVGEPLPEDAVRATMLLRGELAAFDPRIHAARPHPGQERTAEHVRRITAGSQCCIEDARRIPPPNDLFARWQGGRDGK